MLWRHRDFLRLWTAQTISMFGSQVSTLALPFVAVVVLKATAFEVAAMGTLAMTPFVLFALPAGVWVDRLSRRPILIVADWGRALALGSVPLAYAFGALSLAQLYAVSFVTGTLTVFFDVSYQSYLPSLVERDNLVEGNAKLEVSRAASQTGGPAIAGLLVSLLTAPYAVIADAASFVGSALLLTAIRKRELPVETVVERSMRHEIWTGLRYVFRHPLLRPIVWQIAIGNFFLSILSSILIVYAVRVLHLSAASVGGIYAIGNVGLLVGAPLAGRLAHRLGLGPLLIWSAALTGCAYLVFAGAPKSAAPELLAVAQFIWSFGAVMYFVNGITLIQTITPERLLGRVNASRRFAVWGVIPLGDLAGGAIASGIGLHVAIWVGAVGSTLSALPLLASPMRHVRVMDDAHALAPAGS
jgi:MFS family permease